MAYDNKNKGALWSNLKRATPTHPDFRGELNVEGVDYWISCWRKLGDKQVTAPTFTLSINKKEKRHEPPEKGKTNEISFDDDIPF